MLYERKNIKWKTAMVLPEHQEALRTWKEEQTNPPAKMPDIDEQRQEELNQRLYQSLYEGFSVDLHIIDKEKAHQVTGVVQAIDEVKQTIAVIDHEGQNHLIDLKMIVDML